MLGLAYMGEGGLGGGGGGGGGGATFADPFVQEYVRLTHKGRSWLFISS